MSDLIIALQYAMPKEIDSLLGSSSAELEQTVAGVSFYRVTPNIIAVAGGIGKVNAAMAAQLCISLYHPDIIINVGVAGCFRNVAIGTLMIADKYIQHDVDTTGCGDPIGLVSTVNIVEFPVSRVEQTQECLKRMNVPYLCGTGVTGDWFAKRGERAKWIDQTFHPLFIEMEGCAIAQVCMRNQVGFIALKSVSDCLFGDDNYDFNFPKAMENLNTIAFRFARELSVM
jgi:adenosylhomocysteine nucleosidase